MKSARELSRWRSLAKRLLPPEDVARVIEPTLADALCERDTAGGTRAWLWRARVALLSAMLVVLMGNGHARLRQAHWHSYLLLLLAGLSGAAILGGEGARHFALSHVVYLGLAAALGAMIVAVPQRLLHHLGTLAILGSFVGLAACPWWGEAYGGQRCWLRLWALQIQVAVFALPAFVGFVNRCTKTKDFARLSLGVAITLVLVILENNIESTVVYAATLGAALLRARGRLLSSLMTAVLLMAATCAVAANPQGTVWSWLGTAALVLALVFAVHSEGTAPHSESRQPLLVAMVALTAFRGFADDTMPLVGFGGSAIVALFVLMALQMREQVLVTTATSPQ